MIRAKTSYLIIHCSATQAKSDIGFKEIDRWHKERGWEGCGYHFIIRRDGRLEKGRDIEAVGAHAPPYNQSSVGICMVGGIDREGHAENNFTEAQFGQLFDLLQSLKARWPVAEIIGHRDVPGTKKDCPCFDVKDWALGMGLA